MATKRKSAKKDSVWKQIGIGICALLTVGIVGLAGYGTYTIVENCKTDADTTQETDDTTTDTDTEGAVVEATATVNISEDGAVLTIVA